MASGIVYLEPLYAFIQKNRRKPIDALDLKRGSLGKKYSKLCAEVTANVKDSQGVYVWGCYARRKYWKSIYLGKAGLGKSRKLLKERILEELKDERCSLWRAVLTKSKLLKTVGPRVHPEQWRRYIKGHWKRSLRKAGGTHVVWVETGRLGNKKVREVEAALIECFNPTANRQRPVPSTHLAVSTSRAFGELLRRIHEGRRRPLRLRLI